MEITWYGHSCFKLSERGKATVVTDPFDDSIGLTLPKLKSDIITVSHDAPGHASADTVKGARRVVDAPGEYEIGGVFIIGAATNNVQSNPPKRNVAYVFDYEGLTVAHLGDLDHLPSKAMLEELGTINVALVPVGGGGGLNATQASELIRLIEPNPNFVIPMHYQTDQTTLNLDPLDRFLKEMGVSRAEPETVFKVSSSNLPEQTQIIVMNISN